MFLSTALLLVFITLTIAACSPQLGAIRSDQQHIETSNYANGRFQNITPTNVSGSSGEMLKSMFEYVTGGQNRVPENSIPTKKLAKSIKNSI